jgi:hypothetical protein
VVPPPITAAEISGLVLHSEPDHDRADVKRYVELEAEGEQVTHAECLKRETVYGREYSVWDVVTDKDRYWVVTGMTNLYSSKLFPSADYVLSFHIGLTSRVSSRDTGFIDGEQEDPSATAWRRFEQASEALDDAKEAEDFAAVGLRCRECLLEMIRSFGDATMVALDTEAPKRADFNGWTALIVAHVAPESTNDELRGLLRAQGKAAWQYVSWVTHARNAVRLDAQLGLDATAHVLRQFGLAVLRHERGTPDRCPTCSSYQIDSVYEPEAEHERPYTHVCRACGWREPPVVAEAEGEHRGEHREAKSTNTGDSDESGESR